MPKLRAFLLAVAFIGLTLFAVPIQYLAIRFGWRLQKTYPHGYHRFLCRMFGIRLTTIGKPATDRGVLMVANHSGYFDILIMSATSYVSFIAKSEVSGWPLFGLMSKLQRSIFVERTKRSQVAAARDMVRDRLRAGDALVLFPEGTSTDGNRVVQFKSALMGAVESEVGVEADGHVRYALVQPVSISYVACHGIPLGRENRPLFAWYGDMDLLPHLWEALKAGPLDVIVQFHEPISAGPGCGRKQIAAMAEAAVRHGQMRALSGDWGIPEAGTEGRKPPVQNAA